MSMKKWLKKPSSLFVALMAVMLIIQMPAAYASNLGELKSKQSQIEKQKNAINSKIKEKSNAINQNENKQEQLLAQITKLGEEITATNEKIAAVTKEIEKANSEINKLQGEIEILIEKIEQRDALLQDRARAIQENGSVSYLDVLLGANSFVDFIDRFSAVNTLIEADRQIMQDQKEDKKLLEEQKAVLENTKKELEKNYAELEALKNSLDSQKQEKNKLVSELEKEQEKLLSEKALLEEEYSEALVISEELKQQIIAEQNRQLEAARQFEQSKKSSGGSSGSTSVGNLPVSSSGFMKPTTGLLTSPYGWRNLGAGPEFHYGIDIANKTGTPIVAAADGVVSHVGAMGSYGNVVMVTHSINGKIYTTLYAHLSGYTSSVGQQVSRGQQIAKMGSTGRSTGPHLHFEIHTGTWRGQKVGVQNPLNYISL